MDKDVSELSAKELKRLHRIPPNFREVTYVIHQKR